MSPGDERKDTGATLDASMLDGSTFDVDSDEEEAPLVERGADPQPMRAERYEMLEVLGVGGMGEVRRVRDRELKRTVAMKVLKPKLLASPRSLARFREEAQISGQLQHPGIIPIHDIGTLADGRVYFTMKEVRGKTLEDVIIDAHESIEEGADRELTMRRVMATFHRVCETVAYAHSRGVVHRDLKPANVMVGAYGEVLVLDWGLAKVVSEELSDDPFDSIETERSVDSSLRTRVGAVTGTPAFMAPEQARGQNHLVGPSTDVYALGAILYMTIACRPPRWAKNVRALLDLVIEAAPVTPPREVAEFPVDPGLEAIALRALESARADRYPDAGRMAEGLARWLEGAQKRANALEVVERARGLVPEIARNRQLAGVLRDEAEMLESSVERSDPEEKKWPIWDKQDEAERLERRSRQLQVELVQTLQGALTHAPDLAEAHGMLADQYREQHAAAEADGNPTRAEAVLPYLVAHDVAGRYADYISGEGAVTLVTNPPGAVVDLYRYVEKRRRLVPEYVRTLGVTPILEEPLPMGSYLLKLRKEGHVDVRYPVLIGRMEHWDGVRPGSTDPFAIDLPRVGELEDDDCYVPAGFFWSGTEGEATVPLPIRRLWADAFVMKKYPVTNGEYVAFLNDLVARGREEEASQRAPHLLGGKPIFGRSKGGQFLLGKDPDGHEWTPDMPTVLVRWVDAMSFAEWRGWRLPIELEWEKAARGVDRRLFPWGNHLGWKWGRVVLTGGPPGPTSVYAFKTDESVYGVRHLSGMVQNWLLDPHPGGGGTEGQIVTTSFVPGGGESGLLRGASWNSSGPTSASWRRRAAPRNVRWDAIGLRLAKPWKKE